MTTSYDAAQLGRIADRHRRTIVGVGWLVLVYLLVLAMPAFLEPSASAGSGDPASVVSMICNAVAGFVLLYVVANAWSLSRSLGGPGVTSLLVIVPFLGLVYLLLLTNKAGKVLKNHALKPGFWGLDRSEIKALQSSSTSNQALSGPDDSEEPIPEAPPPPRGRLSCPHCRQTFSGAPRAGNRCPLCNGTLDG